MGAKIAIDVSRIERGDAERNIDPYIRSETERSQLLVSKSPPISSAASSLGTLEQRATIPEQPTNQLWPHCL